MISKARDSADKSRADRGPTTMRITILGSGTSHGVPVIGCVCPACVSSDPRDRRYRASALVEAGRRTILIDAGPEFRLQALRAGVERLDALLLTHAHADHVSGLDDVRPLTHKRILPVYGNRATIDEVAERFSYIFRQTQVGGGKPRIDLREMPDSGIDIGGLRVMPVPVLHGSLDILGWRFGGFAYITDCSELSEKAFALLHGVEALVINGLRHKVHETHFSVDQALAAARAIGSRITWLTHINHEHPHAELEAYCALHGADIGARPAWDGLSFEVGETDLGRTGNG
jgi:phosphoribosyl 1,2-cyclic phosphate phosphodiesterase